VPPGAALRILPVDPDRLAAWRAIHNETIPTDTLRDEDVRLRAAKHLLTLAYDGDEAIGCATVRPPEVGSLTAIVIVRILAPFRGKGQGAAYLAYAAWHVTVAGVRSRRSCSRPVRSDCGSPGRAGSSSTTGTSSTDRRCRWPPFAS